MAVRPGSPEDKTYYGSQYQLNAAIKRYEEKVARDSIDADNAENEKRKQDAENKTVLSKAETAAKAKSIEDEQARGSKGKDLEAGAETSAKLVDKYADGAFDKIQDSDFYKEGVSRQKGVLDQKGDLVASAKEQAKGMTSQEMQMMRGKARQSIAGQTQSNLRQIAAMQAQMGVRGGTAGAQQMQAMLAGQNAQAGMEQQLMMQQRAMQQQGLQGVNQAVGSYEGSSNALSQAQGQAFTFDIGTAGQRLGMIAQGATSLAGMSSSERIAKVNADASIKAAKAQGSGGGGGSVVCTVTCEQGFLPLNILRADENFSRNNLSKEVITGYHSWGIPLAQFMKNNKWLTFILSPITKAWAYQMAYLEGEYNKPNILGKILLKVGVPICNIIGKLRRK
jgi:hypothetical protein